MPGADRRGAFIIYTDHRLHPIANSPSRFGWKLALIVTAIMIVAAAVHWFSTRANHAPDVSVAPEPEAPEQVLAAAFEPPALAIDFLRASTLEQKLQYVRNPDAMAEHINQFHDGNPNQPERFMSIYPVTDTTDSTDIQRFYVTTRNDRRLLAIVETPAGPKVDWPAYARLNDVEWNAFIEGKFTAAKHFRVHISGLDYYVGDFSDPQRYKCFQISSPELERDLFGYAERGSQAELGLSALSAPVKRRCILELAPPASPHTRQLVITKLIAEGWVRTD